MSNLSYEIYEGQLGPQMRLNAAWNQEMAQAAADAGVVGLAFGPENRDLSFLYGLPNLLVISYLHDGADIAPIHSLRNLRSIYFANVTKKIDFTCFPSLEECSLEWSSGVSGVFEARNLRKLFIHCLPKAFLPKVGELVHLTNLSIISCTTTSLAPLRSLKKLEKLRIGRFLRLEDNDFLSSLDKLRDLYVQSCSGFSSLEPLSNLKRIEEIALESVGPVNGLAPIADLTELEVLVIYGARGTRLIDKDLSPAWGLPKLRKLWVVGKGGVHWTKPEESPNNDS